MDEKHRGLPDPSRVKAYIIPAGMGLILKKGGAVAGDMLKPMVKL